LAPPRRDRADLRADRGPRRGSPRAGGAPRGPHRRHGRLACPLRRGSARGGPRPVRVHAARGGHVAVPGRLPLGAERRAGVGARGGGPRRGAGPRRAPARAGPRRRHGGAVRLAAVARDILREARARRWVLALAGGTTLLIVVVALGLQLEVVDGALAASRF